MDTFKMMFGSQLDRDEENGLPKYINLVGRDRNFYQATYKKIRCGQSKDLEIVKVKLAEFIKEYDSLN